MMKAQSTGSTSIQKLTSGPLAGYFAATLNVSGVSSLFSHITVGLNLARAASGGPANLDVALLSPSGQVDLLRGPSGPDLVHLSTGQSFNGTLDDAASGTIASGSRRSSARSSRCRRSA